MTPTVSLIETGDPLEEVQTLGCVGKEIGTDEADVTRPSAFTWICGTSEASP
ncbi:MAG: hypothetical protein WBY94_13250 [Polyangiaceae bacterium]